MKAHQQGLAMLTMCLLLTVAATWLAMTVMQLTLDRQRIQAADYRSEAVFSAAEAGLSFAISWLGANTRNRTCCHRLPAAPSGSGRALSIGATSPDQS